MRKILLAISIIIAVYSMSVHAREYEKLGRGTVAIHNVHSGGNYISWRLLRDDSREIGFDVYRDGKKINIESITKTSDYLDLEGKIDSVYEVVAANDMISGSGVSPWSQQYLEIALSAPEPFELSGRKYSYRPNDASVADLDGDGEYEIVLKWEALSRDNSQSGITSPTYLEGLKFSGESLWRIKLGINIRSGAHYTQFVAYDLDGDGKAEVACKTADGTYDGLGNKIGTDKDYRNSSGYILDSPEYLTVFRGRDGKALDTVAYIPPRGDIRIWGDNYGNRVDRFLAGAGWLSGDRPALIMARGYYYGKTGPGRTAIATWNYINGKLVPLWQFDTLEGRLEGYIGQGCHAMFIGDVDNDGYDEIIYGSCAIDHDGKAMYSTRFGHGDAGHLGDLDPDRAGLEFFMPHEDATAGKIPGVSFRDAATGKILWSLPVDSRRDIGRGVAGDIFADSPGAECWSSFDGNLYSCKGEIVGPAPRSCNFLIWWDGDTTRELLDGNWIGKYTPGTSGNITRLLTAEECTSNNGSKATPSISADLFGDWREEVIWPSKDGKALRVYTTVIPAKSRNITLMHDPLYRMAIAWQNSAYNQPPHTSIPPK